MTAIYFVGFGSDACAASVDFFAFFFFFFDFFVSDFAGTVDVAAAVLPAGGVGDVP